MSRRWEDQSGSLTREVRRCLPGFTHQNPHFVLGGAKMVANIRIHINVLCFASHRIKMIPERRLQLLDSAETLNERS